MSEKKDFLLIAGPNGDGKSTIYPALQDINPEGWILKPIYIPEGNFINPDTIVNDHKNKGIDGEREAIRISYEYLEQNKPFARESTLCGGSIHKLVQKVKQTGNYRIITVYVWLQSAELSVARVLHRATKGGHYIPLAQMLDRHLKGTQNFVEKTMKLSDIWVLVDNSGKVPDILAWGGESFSDDPTVMLTNNEKGTEQFINFYKTGWDCCMSSERPKYYFQKEKKKNLYSEPTRENKVKLKKKKVANERDITLQVLQSLKTKIINELKNTPKKMFYVYLENEELKFELHSD